jgi:DNA-binding NtrC family response regulator
MPTPPGPQTHEPTAPIRSRSPARRGLALLGDRGPCVPLPRDGTLVLGSRPDADLRLDDPYVSARHAEIRSDVHGTWIRDLGSTNGTWVDGVRVRGAWLMVGTRLRIGHQRLEVVAADRSGSSTSVHDATTPMIGRSPAFRRLLEQVRRLAPLRPPVLIHGETGTGKELVARALHDLSLRASGPFVALNCAAIAESLAESELFGHVRGAFTGAERTHVGAFQRAHGGTLFLDEVAELPLALQAKLLRVLETAKVSPVGSERESDVDVRVVSATHRPVAEMVAEGSLREDLFHRLGVLVVEVPSLRDRTEDIPALVDHFLAVAGRELGRELWITRAAVDAAVGQPWPGNVRGLKNAILRAAALSDGPIGAEELLAGAAGGPALPPPVAPVGLHVPRGDYATMQRDLLRQVVTEQGSIRRAARVLGVPRSTLGGWLKKRL